MARVPRLKATGQRAVFGVGIVGGRITGAPVTTKKIVKKIPRKEKQLALRSAVAATGVKETVVSRGHMAEEVGDFPLVVVDDLQDLKKTSELEKAFIKLSLWPDIYRVKESLKERAGRGKTRGRRTKHAIGPLLVISENKGIRQAAGNLLGVDVCAVNNLSTELLAPGTHPGRLTVWTKSAFEKLDEIYKVGD
jgi:large subunit ribosomal protein L4e